MLSLSVQGPREEENHVRGWMCLLGFLLLLACERDLSLGEKGGRVYAANCTACHNPDPQLEGVMGPPVFGSSRALLESRIIHGNYPPGYTPKRETQLMQPLPFLASELPALAAFLNPR